MEFAGHPVAGPIGLSRIEGHLRGHPEILAAAVAGRDRLLDRRPHGLLVVVEQGLERRWCRGQNMEPMCIVKLDEIS